MFIACLWFHPQMTLLPQHPPAPHLFPHKVSSGWIPGCFRTLSGSSHYADKAQTPQQVFRGPCNLVPMNFSIVIPPSAITPMQLRVHTQKTMPFIHPSRHPSPSLLWAPVMWSPGPGTPVLLLRYLQAPAERPEPQEALPYLKSRRALSGMLWRSACPL